MSPSFLVKMFELHVEAFHSHKNILSIVLCRSLSVSIKCLPVGLMSPSFLLKCLNYT